MRQFLITTVFISIAASVFAQGEQAPEEFPVKYTSMNKGNQGANDKFEFDEKSELKFELIFKEVDLAAKKILDAGKIQLEDETSTSISTLVNGDPHY
jgi:hypothetical protein